MTENIQLYLKSNYIKLYVQKKLDWVSSKIWSKWNKFLSEVDI